MIKIHNQQTGLQSMVIAPIVFFLGLYFAIIQFSYYFMLEVFLTSRSISYFIALFFWLIGFLIGLNLRKNYNFYKLLAVSICSYYLFYLINILFPFKSITFVFLGMLIMFSGICPGYFFIKYESGFKNVKHLFFIENNGFILGVVFSLYSSVSLGEWFIKFGPILFGTITLILSLSGTILQKNQVFTRCEE